jgi:hypothetical protein
MADQQPTTQTAAPEVTTDDQKLYQKVSEQLKDEFKVCDRAIKPRREAWRLFLKLYINQRKNPKKIGDTLMFSTHQTILASLYKDRLDAEWMWREEGDEDRAEEVNALWEFDYDEMGKAQHDYGKYWDACFFGVSIEDWSHFDRDSLTPIPDLWDPMATLIDPKATSINGNRLGRGAMRFGGREIVRTKDEMLSHGGFITENVNMLDADEKKAQEAQKNQMARDEARGLASTSYIDVDKNKYYALLQWFTSIDGQRYLVEAGNQGETVVRLQKITLDYWPVEISRVYPDPHTLWTPGCPDFTEDKQRARAILQNYTLDAAKMDVLPMYLFDKAKIKNKQQLRDFRAGKMIEGEGIDANTIIPLTKPSIHQFSQLLMQDLQDNAEKALATPQIQQGIISQQNRTATEIAQATANVDTRYSLTASLFSQTEQNTAYMWYDQYKKNFKKGIDKKIVRLVGAFGPKPIPITADTFKFKMDPDVKIESRYISTARKKEQLANLMNYGNVLITTQGSNMRFFARKVGRLMMPKDEVDRLLPPTIDEMRAEDENDKLNLNTLKGVVIEPTDDHKTHLEVHSKAADTKAKFAHIEAHKKAMMMQRNNPALFAQFQQPPPPGMPAPAGAGPGLPAKPNPAPAFPPNQLSAS